METMRDVYLTWHNSLKSVNTIRKYKVSVDMYCEMVFGKKPYELTEADLKGLRYSDTINKFVSPLRNKGVKDSTIKGHLIAMRSLIKMVRREKIFKGINFGDLNDYVLKVDSLSTRDTKHHAALSLSELDDMKKWLCKKSFAKGHEGLGEKYALLIDFMYKTAVRVTATFNITWSDFTLLTSPYGGEWAELNVIDKGRKFNTKYLDRSYYDKLKSIFYNGNDDEKVFGCLSQNTLRSYFREYSDKVGRNIVIHSLKAGAATTLYAQTKDLLLVRDFCDHESVSVTENYIHTQQNPSETGTAILSANYDYDNINSLSKEQLLMLIHSQPEIENMVYMAGLKSKVI